MKRIKYIVCEHIVAQVFDLLLFIILLLSYDGKMFVLRQKKLVQTIYNNLKLKC